eukprot:scaffold5045_cov71-Cyclotella_meneghiniana.AAC.4
MEGMVSGRPSRLLYLVSVNPPLDTTIPLSLRLQATLSSHCFYQARGVSRGKQKGSRTSKKLDGGGAQTMTDDAVAVHLSMV